MILFPTANDVSYDIEKKHISFSMIFFDETNKTNILITFKADTALQEVIEDLLVK
jgi:hypothetical protein